MKNFIFALAIACPLSSFGQNKDTLFFAIDSNYTISPTVTANMHNLTYSKYVEKIKKQKELTQTNGYIYFIGNGISMKGLRPKKIHSIKEYIENRKFYYDGKYNEIINKWKLQDSLTNKFIILFVNGEEFIQPRILEYKSYFPIIEKENRIFNNNKDTLFFKLENETLYESKHEAKKIYLNRYHYKGDEVFYFKKNKEIKNIKIKKTKSFNKIVKSSQFYSKHNKMNLNVYGLIEYLSNYVIILVNSNNKKTEYIQVVSGFEIE